MSAMTIYIVMYYCGDKMFTIVKAMNSLDKAYSYICQQESNMFYQESKTYKLIYANSQLNIDQYSNSENSELGICCVNKGYMNLNFDKNKISEYIIIPKILE
jgi:hypothetical protein